jgi:hypothetical protein
MYEITLIVDDYMKDIMEYETLEDALFGLKLWIQEYAKTIRDNVDSDYTPETTFKIEKKEEIVSITL